ncbi:hypothetical protein FRC10_005833 [Ceratobasidium sp. 414]|nr:hypothetical protein FRC10_005833 [Ceratobasidium sp. 414]
MTVYSRFSRATLWMTNQQGTKVLRANPVPAILPTIRVNLTSEFAIAQAMLPATYHGSIDLRSQYARAGAIDHASRLPGRAVEWPERGEGAARGSVRWVGAWRGDGGRAHVSTEFATVRLLFFGLDAVPLESWPKESDGMEFERDNMIGSLVWHSPPPPPHELSVNRKRRHKMNHMVRHQPSHLIWKSHAAWSAVLLSNHPIAPVEHWVHPGSALLSGCLVPSRFGSLCGVSFEDAGFSSKKLPDSQPQSPVSPTNTSFSQYPHNHVSYSTFPTSYIQPDARYTNNASDITALLGHDSPDSGFLPGDEQPPAYEEVGPSKRANRRVWARGAAIILIVLLSKDVKPTPPLPLPSPPNHSPPYVPSSRPPPISPDPTSSSPDLPTQAPLPPLPPYDRLPIPDLSYVLPDVGRTDLCRPWAYSPDSGARPSNSDKRPVDRLAYTIPSLAPIYIETSAICPTPDGLNRQCTEYDDSKDAVSGKLQVVGADIQLPTVELFLQHGSELGLEDVSVCLMQRSLSTEERAGGSKGHKWVLSINIWKDPTSPTRNNLLASASIILTLPYSHVHNLVTRINYFTQTVGLKDEANSPLLFDTLRLLGSNGHIEVYNVEAAVVEGRSEYDSLLVEDSRIKKSLSLESQYGMVSCNVTLVQTESGPPIQANLQSRAGVADVVVNLEYPFHSTQAPRFEVAAFSQFSRAMIWMTDHQGTELLRTNTTPPTLPTILMNLTSQFATAQTIIPATYHGSLDFRSESAAVRIVDESSQLRGRSVQWLDQTRDAVRGNVRWAGASRSEGGSIRVSTEFAVVRALLLGLNEGWHEKWPVQRGGQS